MSRSQTGETTFDLRRRTHAWSRVSASRRAAGNAAGRVQLDIARDGLGVCNSRTVGLPVFQRPFIDASINLTEVVNAGIALWCGAGTYEVGDRNRRQQADNGHDDHDFHQREARLAGWFVCFHFLLFFLKLRCERNNRRVTIITISVHWLPVETATN